MNREETRVYQSAQRVRELRGADEVFVGGERLARRKARRHRKTELTSTAVSVVSSLIHTTGYKELGARATPFQLNRLLKHAVSYRCSLLSR